MLDSASAQAPIEISSKAHRKESRLLALTNAIARSWERKCVCVLVMSVDETGVLHKLSAKVLAYRRRV